MDATFHRYRLLGPHRAAVETFDPGGPAPGELLVAPDAVGICATDLEIAEGSLIYFRQGMADFPLTPGHEWTGTVLAMGEGVDGFKTGDRVVGEVSVGCQRCATCLDGAYHQCPHRTETGIMGRDGALAEAMRFPAGAAHHVPGHVDPLDAALVEPLAVAVRTLQQADVRAADDVLVVGAGPIGALLIMALVAWNVPSVTVTEPREDRRRLATELGAQPLGESSSRRFSVVLDATGHPEGTSLALASAATRGRVVIVGLSGLDAVPIGVDELVVREISVRGTLASPHTWPAALELIASGGVRPSRIISHQFGLARVEEAFATVTARRPGVHKVVVRPQQQEVAAP